MERTYGYPLFLLLRLNRLRVVEELLGVVLGLDALQPRQVLAVVLRHSLGARQSCVSVVDVGTPVRPRDGLSNSVDPAIKEGERSGGVSLVVLVAVVELDDVELVAVGVRSSILGHLRDFRVLATVRIKLEEPEAVDNIVGNVEVVVNKSLGSSPVQALQGQTLGVEVLLLVLVSG